MIESGDLDVFAGRMRMTAAEMGARMRTGLAAIEPEVGAIGVREIRAATRAYSDDDAHAPLRASTRFTSAITGTILSTAISQPAESKPDRAGNWGGWHYANLVIFGRGEVVRDKKPLAGPHFGPASYSSASTPNPYPQKAVAPIMTALRAVRQRFGLEVSAGLFSRFQ